MEPQPQQVECEECTSSDGWNNHGDRCFQAWLGSHLQRDQNRWILVATVEGAAFAVRPFREVQHTCAPVNGQPDSSLLHKQDGGHSLPAPNAASLPAVEMVLEMRDNTLGRVSARSGECCGGQEITVQQNGCSTKSLM